ncbi:unnamed protein product, partial [Mesorhabditis spiculigera]
MSSLHDMSVRLIFFIFLCGNFNYANGRLQKISVKGTVLCKGRPYTNASIKLMEKDGLDADDELGKKETDKNGKFELDGEEDEFLSIEPYLRIRHTCVEDKTCGGTVDVPIPEENVDGKPFEPTLQLDRLDYTTSDCRNLKFAPHG